MNGKVKSAGPASAGRWAEPGAESVEEIMKKFLSPETETVLQIFERAGIEACLVGGCVRDCLMGRRPGDIDIATAARPEDTERLFANAGFAVLKTGLKHGTVTVLVDRARPGRDQTDRDRPDRDGPDRDRPNAGGPDMEPASERVPVEITTYRVDGAYSDHRHPDSVFYTSKLADDLGRRDFTVNAMAWSPCLGLVDLYGGREDLRNGILRCVGEPEKRFREDPLRILRGLRFMSKLGFRPENRTREALFSEKALLRDVSAERVFGELKKILAGRHAEPVLIEFGGVLGEFIPELLPMAGFDQHNPHHIYDVWTHSVKVLAALDEVSADSGAAEAGDHLRLAALLHDVGKPSCYTRDPRGIGHFYGHAAAGVTMAEEILRRLKTDAFTRERVTLLIRYHDTPVAAEKRLIRRWLSRVGPEVFEELLILKRADNMAQNRARFDRQPQYREIQKLYADTVAAGECFALKDLAVNGRDLMEAGIPQGPEVGRILRLLLSAVVNGEEPNERDELLAYVKRCLTL